MFGSGVVGICGQAGTARAAGGALSGEYGGAGIVLWAIQASRKATVAGRLHQSGTGVRSIAGRNRTTDDRTGDAAEPHQSNLPVVCRQSGYHPIWSTSTSLRRKRNKRRVKTANTFSSAHPSPLPSEREPVTCIGREFAVAGLWPPWQVSEKPLPVSPHKGRGQQKGS